MNFKKIGYFVLGLIVVPICVGLPFLCFDTNTYEDSINFFGGIYLLIYLLFPLLYRQNVQKILPNKYIFYILLYLPFFILFLLSKMN